ncbi:MAG: BACON domain-containing protein [Alistipes sp.]|nr:BACON domain-containing protein [Alistipes sp.]
MKLINKIGLIILACTSLFCGCAQEEAYLVRENDQLSFNCAEQAVDQTIQCQGAWEVDYNGNEWITVTPDSGVGSGEVEYVSIGVAYNRGAERTGTIYINFNGKGYPVTVAQGACDFAYGNLSGEGKLVQNKPAEYTLKLAYTKAYGDESVKLGCQISGAAAAGLVAEEVQYSSFQKGSGVIEYAITGTPTTVGDVTFQMTVDGAPQGTALTAQVLDPSDVALFGFPVFWDFAHYDAGTTVAEKKAALQGTQYDYSWGSSSLNPCDGSAPSTDHKFLDWNFCDVNQAYFTVSGKITQYAYGEGHAYTKGMVHNDYWLMATKVRNLEAGTKLTFEGAIGCSGSGPKVATIEYSVDGGNTWLEAAGGREYVHPWTGDKANIHLEVFTDNQYVNKDANQGVRNDKTAEDGWAKVTFPVEKGLADGWFYLRLRYSLNLRLNNTQASYAIAATGSERVKNEVKIYVAEE